MNYTFNNGSMYHVRRLLLAFSVLCMSISLFSCKKELGELDQLTKDMSGYNAIHYEVGESMDLYGTLYNTVTSYVNVPVELNSPATNDTVFATVDPSLVTAFNQLYNENNLAIPDSAFSPSHNGVFPIVNGESYSLDSLYADLHDASKLQDSALYLIPIRLREKQSNGLKVSVVFFKMRYLLKGGLYAYPNVSLYLSSYNGYYLSDFYQVSAYNLGLTIKIPVKLNTVFLNHDLKVSAKLYNGDSVSNSLSTFSPPYAFPENTMSLTKSEVTIPAGSLNSKDSLVLVMQPGVRELIENQNQGSRACVILLEEYSDINHRVPLKTGYDRVIYSAYLYK